MSASTQPERSVPGIPGVLSLYRHAPHPLPYHTTDPTLPHALIYVPGLTDTPLSSPFLPLLATTLQQHGYSLVQPLLPSALGGYGLSTLEGDAEDLAALVAHLRPSRPHGKLVLLGHSTGCQDAIAYLLSRPRAHARATSLDAVILQAPVSDHEDYAHRRSQLDASTRAAWDARTHLATQLVSLGKGGETLPRLPLEGSQVALARTTPYDPPSRSADADAAPPIGPGNAPAVALHPAISAYRHLSLSTASGDDNLFPTTSPLSLDTSPGARTLARAIANLVSNPLAPTAKLLAVMGAEDEFVPPHVDREAILLRWRDAFHPLFGSERVQTCYLAGANHKIDNVEAQSRLVQRVVQFLETL